MTSKKPPRLAKGDHLYLIDGSGYIFRAYFALPPLTRSDGTPVGAVAGFCNMLHKLLQDAKDGKDNVTHIAVIFDAARKNFRNEIYPEYKANREEPPEDLIPQFGLIRDAVKAFNVPMVEQEGYEADDLIATYSRDAVGRGAEVTIISSDKDLMQLLGPEQVHMLDPKDNSVIDEERVLKKFGVGPDKVIDVQALAGDSTDNVPGVPGIGVKTAAQLIEEYGDLDSILEHAEEIKQPKRRQNLIEFAEQARISRQLVELKNDVPVEVGIDQLVASEPDAESLLKYLSEMEFKTLLKRVASELGVEAPEVSGDAKSGKAGAKSAGPRKGDSKKEVRKQAADARGKPGAVIPGLDKKIDRDAYQTVLTIDVLDQWIDAAFEAGVVGFDTETTSLRAMEAELVGLSLALEPGRACYIPVGHTGDDGDGLELAGDRPPQIARSEALERLKPLLEDPGVLKVGQNLKYDIVVMAKYGIRVAPIDDTMLLSYALDAGLHGHGMDELSELHLAHTPMSFKEVAGTGKSRVTFDKVPIDKATAYAAEDADVTLRLYGILKPRLVADRMATVYETLERPMVHVLADMEQRGVKVDRDVLSRLSGEFAQRMAALEHEIHELAGESFNIGSPKQLGEILFERMGIEGGKKTKTGAYSTGADVLEELAAMGHDLPQRVLDWRQLSKLKGTYTDALVNHINAETGRVHTSYSLASTSTGRLASNEPNLQNIPIRTDEGRKIRQAFVADKGRKLISADYSQIELRLLAHIADIDALKKAFDEGLDIHAMTASQIFDVPIKDMDPMVRRRAKAINFGIIYGISAFGLANQLQIPQADARAYIDAYFKRFPGIRDYMEETKEYCRKNGYVKTVFGRKCHMPGINQKNPSGRAFVERAAINAPIQGSAADIIRRAMIRIPDALSTAKLDAMMLLQVHDELIFEVPEKQVDKTCKVVREVMEGACRPALSLSVPLTVDAQAGDSWAEAH